MNQRMTEEAQDPAQAEMKARGVLVKNVSAMHPLLANCLRLTVGTHEENAQMLAALKKSNDWNSGWFKATEVVKLVISDPEWYVRRHEISGAILHRYIRAAVAMKSEDGTCGYRFITYQEDYIGGKFQPMKYDGASDRHAINCNNIK